MLQLPVLDGSGELGGVRHVMWLPIIRGLIRCLVEGSPKGRATCLLSQLMSFLFNLPFPSGLCQFMMFLCVIPSSVVLISWILDP